MPLTLDIERIKILMRELNIPTVSVGYCESDEVSLVPISINEESSSADLNKTPKQDSASSVVETPYADSASVASSEKVYGAASLSKPVFAYLVHKLVADGKLDLDEPLETIFPFREYCKENGYVLDESDADKIASLTAKKVLSHQTGLPIVHIPAWNPLSFEFFPGEQYGYSGLGYEYLQRAVEKRMGDVPLETLAQHYVFSDLVMTQSTFIPPVDPSKPVREVHAANSLHTTASDYLLFVRACMNDPDLKDAMKTPVVKMISDEWATSAGVSEDDLAHVGWNMIFGVEIGDKNNVTRAYHSGDMGNWRAWVAMDLENSDEKKAIVFFSDSPNAHLLAELIVTPNVSLRHAGNYFFQKYGFARYPEELPSDWRENPSHGIRSGFQPPPTLSKKNADDRAEYEETASAASANSVRVLRSSPDMVMSDIDVRRGTTASIFGSLGGASQCRSSLSDVDSVNAGVDQTSIGVDLEQANDVQIDNRDEPDSASAETTALREDDAVKPRGRS